MRPTRVAPLAIFLRDDAGWLLSTPQPSPKDSLSHPAQELLAVLETRGASFFADLARATGRLASEVEDGLWELVAAGLVTADGFENLRALLDPKRRRGEGRSRTARPRHAPGRWALLRHTEPSPDGNAAAFARQLLARWGVVFRDVATREPLAPAWRDLLVELRRMESRGEIRGGRFIASFIGENYPSARPSPSFQRAVAEGRVTVENWSMWGLLARLVAGGLGIPLMPVRSMAGSSMEEENRHAFAEIPDPFLRKAMGLAVGEVGVHFAGRQVDRQRVCRVAHDHVRMTELVQDIAMVAAYRRGEGEG